MVFWDKVIWRCHRTYGSSKPRQPWKFIRKTGIDYFSSWTSVKLKDDSGRIDKRYSPETEMKWSLPRTVWRISVALRSLGLWLRIKAAALLTYARTVIWMISFGRIIPWIWRSWIVPRKWRENWLSWDGCEATRDLMAKHLSDTSTLQWATSYSRIGESIWMETNRKARGP